MNSPYLCYNQSYPYSMMGFSRKISETSNESPKPSDFLTPGESAPNFTLEGIINGQPRSVSLSDYSEKWVVLFFYSSDFSFV